MGDCKRDENKCLPEKNGFLSKYTDRWFLNVGLDFVNDLLQVLALL